MPDASNNPPRERFAPEGDSLVFPLPGMDGDPEAGDDADTTLPVNLTRSAQPSDGGFNDPNVIIKTLQEDLKKD